MSVYKANVDLSDLFHDMSYNYQKSFLAEEFCSLPIEHQVKVVGEMLKNLYGDQTAKVIEDAFDNLHEQVSKDMRAWSKFAWKKGDILVNKDAEVHIIFDGFKDDTYKTFHGHYYLWEEEGSIVNFEENEDYMQTSEFYKANKEEAQTYINTIEERLGGKLNRETLEIEKAQPEFKDGDIVMSDSGTIVLVRGISLTRKIYYHAYMRNEYIYQPSRRRIF